MVRLPFRRGDIVICVFSGDYGKPRPAVVVQSDLFNETHASVVLCPVSSEITGLNLLRVKIPASETTGLRAESEVMVDKLAAVGRERIRKRAGRLSSSHINLVDRALRTWLSLEEAKGNNP
jgi:mRNA interferase MazF